MHSFSQVTLFLSLNMSMCTEQELITLLQAKEKRGFDLLYDQYGPCLYLFILRRVGDGQLAEELLEESVSHIWRQVSGYDSSKGTLVSWLLTITRNTTHDRLRASV